MQLIEQQGYTTYVPNSYTSLENDHTYTAVYDSDYPDPREDWDENTTIYAYSSPVNKRNDDVPKNIPSKAFAHFYEYFSAEKSLETVKRYLAIFHPELDIQCDARLLRGYSQGDWLEVFAAVPRKNGELEGYIREYNAWLQGDIWIVTNEDTNESISGIFASTEEKAVTYFIQEYDEKAKDEARAPAPQSQVSAPPAQEEISVIVTEGVLGNNIHISSTTGVWMRIPDPAALIKALQKAIK